MGRPVQMTTLLATLMTCSALVPVNTCDAQLVDDYNMMQMQVGATEQANAMVDEMPICGGDTGGDVACVFEDTTPRYVIPGSMGVACTPDAPVAMNIRGAHYFDSCATILEQNICPLAWGSRRRDLGGYAASYCATTCAAYTVAHGWPYYWPCSLPPPSSSPTSSPTPPPTTFPTGFPTSSPTASPTGFPTSSPTASPAGSATSSQTGPQPFAKGDPHLQNVFGERFDLLQPGTHTLASIPRGWHPQDALFRVTARADNIGGKCADMYFEVVNVTGEWVEHTVPGGLLFAGSYSDDHMGSFSEDYMARWLTLGPVGLKVVRGHLVDGTAYLNLFLKNVGKSGYHVGGLLGEDDHEKEMTPSVGCIKYVDLHAEVNELDISHGSTSQTMTGSIAQVLVD